MMDVKQIKQLVRENYKVDSQIAIDPQTGMISAVDGGVELKTKNTPSLLVQWKYVAGDFKCSLQHLETLQGAPSTVGDSFLCYNNQLTSLEGAPHTVGWNFSCVNNNLTSLVGGPRIVGGNYRCYNNRLTSLEGLPERVGNVFEIGFMPKLPILKVLLVKDVRSFQFLNKDLNFIMNKYIRTGYNGMVPCARELIKAGFKGNARL
jgi:hypothetical protein